MNDNPIADFRSGDVYVLKATAENTVARFDGKGSPVTGELHMALGVDWIGLNLLGLSVPTKHGQSGTLSFAAAAHNFLGQHLPEAAQTGALEEWYQIENSPAEGRLIGERFVIDPKDKTRLVLEQVGHDLYAAPDQLVDRFEGTFSGRIKVNPSNDGPPFDLTEARFELTSSRGDSNRVAAVTIELNGPLFLQRRYVDAEAMAAGMQGQAAQDAAVQAIADSGAQVVMQTSRTLRIRRVFFSGNGQVTGNRSIDLVAAAATIWDMACIDIVEDANSPQVLNDPQRMVSGDASFIVAAVLNPPPPPGVISVFFVDNQLGGGGVTPLDPVGPEDIVTGGAVALAGTGLDKVVISDCWSRIAQNGDLLENLQLLAHELGHVLRGWHPDEAPLAGFWVAHDNTVLKASGRPWRANPGNLTQDDCLRAWSVALESQALPIPDCSISPNLAN